MPFLRRFRDPFMVRALCINPVNHVNLSSIILAATAFVAVYASLPHPKQKGLYFLSEFSMAIEFIQFMRFMVIVVVLSPMAKDLPGVRHFHEKAPYR